MSKKGIHWLRHDLRLSDNEALIKLANEVDELALVYVFDPKWLNDNTYGYAPIGQHRLAFLQQSLQDIQSQLSLLGHTLYCFEGNGAEVIANLVSECEVDQLSYEFHAGLNEQEEIAAFALKHPEVILHAGYSNYLYCPDALPFDIADMPDVFSPFRRKVEKYALTQTPSKNAFLPKGVLDISGFKAANFNIDSVPIGEYKGGETQAHLRVNEYFFNTDNIARYKETRNGLDGWDFSSRLSAYLALGCITPRQIVAYLDDYENTRIKNDSTYWLFFELLWREFFHWQHHKHGKLSFIKQGLRETPAAIPSNCSHDARKLGKWILGETGFPIVDACMKQLKATGFMSNRGRQLVASCFVHELGLDWRWGAAYFEHALIDFDVASNYGNWQYLAGVGSDPRGLRQFNLEKQTQIYDPDARFIKKWA